MNRRDTQRRMKVVWTESHSIRLSIKIKSYTATSHLFLACHLFRSTSLEQWNWHYSNGSQSHKYWNLPIRSQQLSMKIWPKFHTIRRIDRNNWFLASVTWIFEFFQMKCQWNFTQKEVYSLHLSHDYRCPRPSPCNQMKLVIFYHRLRCQFILFDFWLHFQ